MIKLMVSYGGVVVAKANKKTATFSVVPADYPGEAIARYIRDNLEEYASVDEITLDSSCLDVALRNCLVETGIAKRLRSLKVVFDGVGRASDLLRLMDIVPKDAEITLSTQVDAEIDDSSLQGWPFDMSMNEEYTDTLLSKIKCIDVQEHAGIWTFVDDMRVCRLIERMSKLVELSVSYLAASRLPASLVRLKCHALDLSIEPIRDGVTWLPGDIRHAPIDDLRQVPYALVVIDDDDMTYGAAVERLSSMRRALERALPQGAQYAVGLSGDVEGSSRARVALQAAVVLAAAKVWDGSGRCTVIIEHLTFDRIDNIVHDIVDAHSFIRSTESSASKKPRVQ